MRTALFASLVALTVAGSASAACMNKFVARSERPHQVVTLLTGKLTFQEAQALAAAIQKKQAPPVQWVDANGRTISSQFGELKVVRPMPVGCDGRASGVVVIATFPNAVPPVRKMMVKLGDDNVVEFEEQQ